MSSNMQPDLVLDVVVIPRTRDLGDNSEVRRALPTTQRRMVGPFVFLNQMGPHRFTAGSGRDVRPHPHNGLATVTYQFDGEILHRDSLGTVQSIQPGDVNWMTAGRGIAHSERTAPEIRQRDSSQLLVLKPGKSVTLSAASQATRLMLLGGEPMDGPRTVVWNFVASSVERIEQAKQAWKA